MDGLRGGDIVSVGDVLAGLKASSPLGGQLKQADLWNHWAELAGAELAPHTLPYRIARGDLQVLVESAVWMHKLAYHRWRIVRAVNRLAGEELVGDIYVQLADEWPPFKDAEPPTAPTV